MIVMSQSFHNFFLLVFKVIALNEELIRCTKVGFCFFVLWSLFEIYPQYSLYFPLFHGMGF